MKLETHIGDERGIITAVAVGGPNNHEEVQELRDQAATILNNSLTPDQSAAIRQFVQSPGQDAKETNFSVEDNKRRYQVGTVRVEIMPDGTVIETFTSFVNGMDAKLAYPRRLGEAVLLFTKSA